MASVQFVCLRTCLHDTPDMMDSFSALNPPSSWLSEAQVLLCQKHPFVNIAEVDFAVGVKFMSPNRKPLILDLNAENVAAILRIDHTQVLELFCCVKAIITAKPFGGGITRDTNKDVYTFTYYSATPVLDCANGVLGLYVASLSSKATTSPEVQIQQTGIVLPDYSTVDDSTFCVKMLQMPNDERKVYLHALQSSYSHLSPLVMKNFTFPDLTEVPAPHLIHQELLSKTNIGLVTNLTSFRDDILLKMSDIDSNGQIKTAEGRMWKKYVTEIVAELELLAEITPSLLTLNEALRRLIINPFALRAAKLVRGNLLVETKFCVDSKHPPLANYGTGTVDYTISDATVLLNTPDPDDIPVDLPHDITSEVEANALYAEIKTELTDAAAHQGLGGCRDMMLVENLVQMQNDAAAHTMGSKRKRAAETLEPVYMLSTSYLILSTGHTWRLYQLKKPVPASTKLEVRYGGEWKLPVLHYLVPPSESELRSSGAAARGTAIDPSQVLDILCMLVSTGLKQL